MKKKPGFRLNNVCGVNVLIAEGKENIDFSYEIDANTPLPYSQALADVESTVKAWKEAGIIED